MHRCAGALVFQIIVHHAMHIAPHALQVPQLPFRPGLSRAHPGFQHAKIAFDLCLGQTEIAQPLTCHGQTHLKDQIACQVPPAILPDQLGLEPVPGSGIEVGAGSDKGQVELRRVWLPRQRIDETVIERRVGRHVQHRRSAWQYTLLQTQVSQPAFIEADQRPHPAPDGAVVQAQMRVAIRRFFQRHGQQHRIMFEILLEQFQRGYSKHNPGQKSHA